MELSGNGRHGAAQERRPGHAPGAPCAGRVQTSSGDWITLTSTPITCAPFPYTARVSRLSKPVASRT